MRRLSTANTKSWRSCLRMSSGNSGKIRCYSRHTQTASADTQTWPKRHSARSIFGETSFSNIPPHHKRQGTEFMVKKAVILVVEDEALIRLSAIQMLEDAGFATV